MHVWTSEEVLKLKELYPQLGLRKTAEKLGCSENSVRRKASILKLKTNHGNKRWSESDIRFMKDNYLEIGAAKCSEKLKRSRHAIAKQASKMGLKVQQDWDAQSLEKLKDVYTELGPKRTAEILNRTYAAVKKMASQLNLKAPRITGYSPISIEWLDSLNNSNIKHAENGGEEVIAGYWVDGYDPTTNTVYEFHGDVFHGNLDIYNPEDTPNPYDKRATAEQLWQKTYDRMEKLSEVAKVIYIWEKDYREGKNYECFEKR